MQSPLFTALNPSKILLKALWHVDLTAKAGGKALDAGTGVGRDAIFLATRGFSVLAIDNQLVFADEFNAMAKKHNVESLVQFQHCDLISCDLGENEFDFIHAKTVLNLMLPKDGKNLLDKILKALKPGGVLAVQVETVNMKELNDDFELFGHMLFELKKVAERTFQVEGMIYRMFMPGELMDMLTDYELLMWEEIKSPNSRVLPWHPEVQTYSQVIIRKTRS